MIKIKGQFENGAQMRQELLALLGMDGAQPVAPQVNSSAYLNAQQEIITKVFGDAVSDEPTTQVEEKPKAKRTSKAAEALKANTGTEEPPASVVNIEETEISDEALTLAQDNAEQNTEEAASVKEETAPVAKTYTLDDAKTAAARLSRAGQRDAAKAIAYRYAILTNPNVDKDGSLVPKIAPQHFAAFIAEIEEAGK